MATAKQRTQQVQKIADDFRALFPPQERAGPDGFEVVEERGNVRRVRAKAEEFQNIADGAKHLHDRWRFYSDFRVIVNGEGKSRAKTPANLKIWDRIQIHLDRLSRMD